MAFLVRKGNPKQIHSWNDGAQRREVDFPESENLRQRTLYVAGGTGRSGTGQSGRSRQNRTVYDAVCKNVEVFDTGGRGATTTFVDRGLGDVLISFESEVNAIRQQYADQGYEVIVPDVDILAEFPVARLDKNVTKNQTTEAAKAYLNYLYTPPAQKS